MGIVPFGGGPRQFLGRKSYHPRSFNCEIEADILPRTERFGRAQVMCTIVCLLQEFDNLENMEARGPIKFHHSIKNRSGIGV